MVSPRTFGSPVESEFATDLRRLRPELANPYCAALPAARATVLVRLWRGLCIDPLPRVTGRRPDGAETMIVLADGRRLVGPTGVGGFSEPPADLVIRLDGHPYTHPADLLAALGWPEAKRLEAEVAHSVAGLALARVGAARLGYPATALADRTLEQHEQSVVDGHPLHPCCRNRTGFRAMDHLAYGPEHHPVVALDLLAVPADRCVVRGAWPAELRAAGRLLLPVHPWQSARVLPRHGLAPHDLRVLPARPLMALRTLAPIGRAWHVKTALSTQLTSAVRDISGGSIQSSVAVSAFLQEAVGRLGGGLSLQPNRAAAAILIDGEPHPDLAAVLRDCPTADLRPGETVLPVAALTTRPPEGGCPPLCALAADDPVAWLADFGALAIPPLLTLLAWGIALEAHEQNLLLVLSDSRPRRLVYRDLADIRLCPARLDAAGLPWPAMPGRLRATSAELRAKLFATFVATTLNGLVTTLAKHTQSERLWDTVGVHVRRAYATMPDTSVTQVDQRALLSEPIPAKPLTLMRLDTSTSAWAYQPNPFSA
ncbi:MAG: IucA/IucC family protein [Pseudonocardiaceae bacterium]